jgi:hypothetical protein
MISDNQLTQFHGRWQGDEELFATAWTEAGAASATLALGPGPGGALLLDYLETRGDSTLQGHGVVVADAWWWFDSYGYLPATPGSARWERGELTLVRTSERGRTTTVLSIVDGMLEQRIDTAVPADAESVPLLRGRYARVGGPDPRF